MAIIIKAIKQRIFNFLFGIKNTMCTEKREISREGNCKAMHINSVSGKNGTVNIDAAIAEAISAIKLIEAASHSLFIKYKERNEYKNGRKVIYKASQKIKSELIIMNLKIKLIIETAEKTIMYFFFILTPTT